MTEIVFKYHTVRHVLDSLTVIKTSGPDLLLVLKKFAPDLTPVIYKLFSLSFIREIFPKIWKNILVQPIPKKVKKTRPAIYRRIILRSIISKSRSEKYWGSRIVAIDISKAFNQVWICETNVFWINYRPMDNRPKAASDRKLPASLRLSLAYRYRGVLKLIVGTVCNCFLIFLSSHHDVFRCTALIVSTNLEICICSRTEWFANIFFHFWVVALFIWF